MQPFYLYGRLIAFLEQGARGPWRDTLAGALN